MGNAFEQGENSGKWGRVSHEKKNFGQFILIIHATPLLDFTLTYPYQQQQR